MKLHELIVEAFLDKFYRSELGQRILNPNITFAELAEIFRNQGIFLRYDTNPQLGYRGAAVEVDRVFNQVQELRKSRDSQKRRRGERELPWIRTAKNKGFKKAVILQVPFGIKLTDKVYEKMDKSEIIELIQHELQHVFQPQQEIEAKTHGYVQSYKGKRLLDIQDLAYMSQVIERPAQAVSLSRELVQIGKTPDDLYKDMKSIAQGIIKELDANSSDYDAYGYVFERTKDYENAKLARDLITNYAYAKHDYENLIPAEDKKQNPRIKAAYQKAFKDTENLFKQLRQTYRKVKGYSQRYH